MHDFRSWLSGQRRRDDAVGDLARDVVRDASRPAFRSLAEWSDHLGGPGSRVHDALVAAWREFAREASSRPRDRRPSRRFLAKWSARTRSPRRPSFMTRTRIMERDDFRCRRCGRGPGDGVRLEVDHIVPVALGGSGEDDNLQTLCWDCNRGKRDRVPHAHDLQLHQAI